MTEMGDEELMQRFQGGDVAAFDLLFARYHRAVHRFIYHFIDSLADADDLLQDVFLSVARAGARYEPRTKFKPWLFRIARNRCLNALERERVRRQFRSQSRSELERARGWGLNRDVATSDRNAAMKDTMDKLQQVLAELPERQREALLLFAMEGMRYREISEIMRTPIGTVKTYIHRARLHIAKEMKEELE